MAHGCSESVSGHGMADKHGKCPWCGKKIDSVLPAPTRYEGRTKLDTEYRRTYNPDFGNDPDDV